MMRRGAFELPSHSEAVGRQVVVGSRAGGLLDVHAAAVGWCWSVVVVQKRGARSRVAVQRGPTELCSRPRVAEQRKLGSRHTRLGPLRVVVAPLAAGGRVSMGAAAVSRAWPPALLESVAYLSSVRRFSCGIAPANNGMQLT